MHLPFAALRLQLPPAHRFARINYVTRTTSFAYSFLVVCLLMLERGVDFWTSALAVLTLLAYPHLAYAHACLAVDSKRAEFRNLNADSVLMGIWIAQMQFALWPSCGALVAISMDNAVCGGVKRFAAGLLVCAASAALWSAMTGYQVRFETGPLLTVLCFIGIIVYVVSLALFMHQQNARLLRTRSILRSSEAQFRFIAEHAGDLVAVLDPKGGFRYASPSHTDYFLPQTCAAGAHWTELVHPHDRERAQAFLERLRSSRQSERIKLRMMTVKEDLLLAECDGNPVRDAAGELQMIVLILRNLSERARPEVDLRLAASAYDRLTEGVLICDGAGRIEFVNKAYGELVGHASGELVGQNVDASRSGLPSQHLYQAVLESVNRDDAWHGSYMERRKDGRILMLSAGVHPLRDAHGNVVHTVWTMRDHTLLPETLPA